MKRIIFLLFVLVATSTLFAQTQQGIVKTNGRPNKPGTPLSNVAVKVSGRSTSLSNTEGTFSIAMDGMKGGEAFFLTSVTKMGYELADKNAIGRKYGFSTSVPMVLSMISKSEVEAEKQRIRNNAIEATQKKYEQQVEELEKQLEAQTITADAFGEQLQELQAKMDKYNELVENLADKYARTDYDQIDAIDQEINLAIEEGLFDKADSLIHTKGDIDERHQKAIEWSQSSKKQKEALDQQMAEWESSEASRRKELENLAEDYYHSFTIEVSRMHQEEAVKWLEKRSELDPECFEWLMEVGKYYKTYLAKYDKAMEYFNRANKIAQKTKQPLQLISVLLERGGVFARLSDIKKAEKCFLDALGCAEKNPEELFQALASVYTNLGYMERQRLDYDKALEYYEKSLTLAPDTLLENAAITYANISAIYYYKSQFGEAEEYLDKAIELAARKDDKLALASLYSNRGVYLNALGKEKEALDYYEKALALQKEILPSCHPDIALTLTNIAEIYHSMSRMKERLENISQALDIYQKTYGEMHPRVAGCYLNIADIFSSAGLYDKALTFANKSWEINSTFYPETSEEYASCCISLGLIYSGLKNKTLALEYYIKAKEISETLGLQRTSTYTNALNNISSILCDQKKYDEALEYANKYLESVASLKGRENNSYILGLNNLAYTYAESGNADAAMATYHDAEELVQKVYGRWHKQLGANYNNVGHLFMKSKEYEKARDYFQRSLEICDSIYNEPAEMTMTVLVNIAMTYYDDGEWKETLSWLEKAIPMRLQLVQEPGRRFAWHSYIYDCNYELAKSGEAEDIQRFKECQDSIWFKVVINPGGVAEQKYGLSGEYVFLRYGNWEQGSMLKFSDESVRLRDVSPIDMVVYKDGKVERLCFEEKKKTLGVSFFIMLLGESEAQTIKEAYEKWKKDHPENLPD